MEINSLGHRKRILASLKEDVKEPEMGEQTKVSAAKLVEIILLNVMLELILTTDVVSLLGYQMLSFTTV